MQDAAPLGSGSPRIRLTHGRIAIGAAVAIAVVIALATWLALGSTQPGDPLSRQRGLGFENSGLNDVPVGQARVLTFRLAGDTPSSTATILGVSLPGIPGLKVRAYAFTGAPQGTLIGYPISPTHRPGYVTADQLVPLRGRRLHTVKGSNRRMIVLALVATPERQGCFTITGVSVIYRVGDSTFTKPMDGWVHIATPAAAC
jgi:hypothetical protein